MNSRAFTLSLIIAGIAVFMVYSYIDGRESQFIQEFGNETPVVVAKVDITELELLDDRKVQVINVPAKYKMPGAFSSIEEIYNTIASVPILTGEQITKPRITYPGARTGLSRQISIGKRAFSLQITEGMAVSKLIKPGDRIDILAMIDYAGGRKDKMKVKTVLQDVYVLATGYNVTKDLPLVGMNVQSEVKTMKLNTYTNYNSITVELTPYEVQKLYFIIQTGAMYFSLRNNDDKNYESISGTKLFDIMGDDQAEAKAYFQQIEDEKNRAKR